MTDERDHGTEAGTPDTRIAEARAALQTGHAAAAKRIVAEVLSLEPKHVQALILAGRLAKLSGRDEQARESLETAIELDGEQLDARLALAAVLRRQREFDRCLDELSYVLYRDPENARAYFELGNLHNVRGDHKGAIDFFRKALEIEPDFVAAMIELGHLYLARNRDEEALGVLERAAELDPLSIAAQSNLAYNYARLEQYERGYEMFTKLCAMTPDSVLGPRINLGNALDSMGQFARSERIYEQVLRHEANNFTARWNRATLILARHDFERGWEEYEYRLQQDGVWAPRLIPFRPWKGEPLEGKTVVVGAEQGLGDQIMFASCLPELIRQAGKVYVECDERLAALFIRSFPDATVLPGGHEMKPRWLREVGMPDFNVWAGSLPRYLRGSLDRFPEHEGYLRPDPAKVARWRDEVARLGAGLKVGVSWRGGTSSTRRRLRSLVLADFAPILRVPGCHFVNLQYGDVASEIDACAGDPGVRVAHWPAAIEDYDETAALCCALDLTISVCTAVIHLNGALGRPVWVLVPAVAEWRYGRTGSERMPWYPSARLIRQAELGEWEPVIEQVATQLQARASAKSTAGE